MLKYNENSIIYYKLGNIYVDHFNFIVLILAKFTLGYVKTTFIVANLNLKSLNIDIFRKKSLNDISLHDLIAGTSIVLFIIMYVKYIIEYISFSLKVQPFKSDYEFTLHSVLQLNNLAHNILFISVLSIFIFGILNYLLDCYLNKKTYYKNLYNTLDNIHLDIIKLLNAFVSMSLSFGYYGLFVSGLVIYTHYIPSGYIAITNII